jgi:hypothetical protein
MPNSQDHQVLAGNFCKTLRAYFRPDLEWLRFFPGGLFRIAVRKSYVAENGGKNRLLIFHEPDDADWAAGLIGHDMFRHYWRYSIIINSCLCPIIGR